MCYRWHIGKTGGATKALPVCCIWKPQLYISPKSGGVVVFGYPLATYKNKIPTKSMFVPEAGLEPAQPSLAKGF